MSIDEGPSTDYQQLETTRYVCWDTYLPFTTYKILLRVFYIKIVEHFNQRFKK